MKGSQVIAGPITLHLEPDEEPYDDHPHVGIVACATLTVDIGTPEQPFLHEVALRSHGVWGIECPDLYAGCPIPKGNWVLDCYGQDEIRQIQDLIDSLAGGGAA